MVAKILCVAEKPSIARAVAAHLGGRYETVSRCALPNASSRISKNLYRREMSGASIGSRITSLNLPLAHHGALAESL